MKRQIKLCLYKSCNIFSLLQIEWQKFSNNTIKFTTKHITLIVAAKSNSLSLHLRKLSTEQEEPRHLISMFSFSLSSEILLCSNHGNTQQRCVCHGKSESLSQLQYFNGLQTDGYLLGFQKAAFVVFWVCISRIGELALSMFTSWRKGELPLGLKPCGSVPVIVFHSQSWHLWHFSRPRTDLSSTSAAIHDRTHSFGNLHLFYMH